MLRTLLICFFVTALLQAVQAQQVPINKKATAETKNLYANLQRMAQQGIMFGHQDALAYGVGWQYQDGRSDVKEVVGEYPAVVGWDIGHLELERSMNLDSVPFDKMRTYIQQVYAMGGINTISWHPNNPVDPTKSSWDSVGFTIRKVLADRKAMKRYKSWLDEVADFSKSLKGPQGELIPVIFRPLHEHTGSWFWWGKAHCTPEEYKQFWHLTVDHLRKKKAHNLLFAYSTGTFTSKEDYLERYPGDDYVDIIGFDTYFYPSNDTSKAAAETAAFVANSRRMVEQLREMGQERNKVWALTETGYEKIPDANWWNNTLLPIVQNAGLSYVLVWRNARPDHHYAPQPGHVSAEDFKRFYNRPEVWFQKRVAEQNVYQAQPQNLGQNR